MRLLEHQSKALLKQFGLTFSVPCVVSSVEAAVAAAREIGPPVVLKAQVPFGGRGKAGAIITAESLDEGGSAAEKLLGMRLREFPVKEISLEPRIEFTRALYIGAAWDTSARRPIALLSSAGGVDIEAADEKTVARRHFDPFHGLRPYEGRAMALQLRISGKTMVQLGSALANLASAFLRLDARTVEINPIVERSDGTLLGLDAHVEIDDDAAYRQRAQLTGLGPLSGDSARPSTALEEEARRIDAMDHRGVAGRVVEFGGDLALLIGGGGASLTVFDAIRRYGGKPANYCEVGGNPVEEKVAALTKLLLSKPGVRQLSVIMNVVNNTRADVMARGVLEGVRSAGREPAETIAVFRIPGSWEQEAVDLLREAGVTALGRETSLDECARLAVQRSAAHVV